MSNPENTSSFTSENQPPQPPRNDTSPLREDAAPSENTRSFQSLITGFPTGVDNVLRQTDVAARTSFVRELGPPGTAEGSTDWYNMCTETLGFESLADVSSAQSSLISSSSRLPGVMMRENMNLNETSAFLSALDSNTTPRNDLPTTSLSTLDDIGRPRFRFEQVRSDGRLTMTMFEKDMPEIGRTVAKEILGGDQDINDNMPEIGLTVTEEIVNDSMVIKVTTRVQKMRMKGSHELISCIFLLGGKTGGGAGKL